MSVIVSPAAQADAINTARWYDNQPSRYGDAFNDELRTAIRKIGKTPRLYPLVEDGVPGREIREYFIARFSQRIIYVMNGDDVLIVAVIHTNAREGAWHGNLPPASPPEST
jgi:plasmid stabilization system protein ParE